MSSWPYFWMAYVVGQFLKIMKDGFNDGTCRC